MIIYPYCRSKILWHILLFPNTGNLGLSPTFPVFLEACQFYWYFQGIAFPIFMLIDFCFVFIFFVFPWLPKMEEDYLVKEFIS